MLYQRRERESERASERATDRVSGRVSQFPFRLFVSFSLSSLSLAPPFIFKSAISLCLRSALPILIEKGRTKTTRLPSYTSRMPIQAHARESDCSFAKRSVSLIFFLQRSFSSFSITELGEVTDELEAVLAELAAVENAA